MLHPSTSKFPRTKGELTGGPETLGFPYRRWGQHHLLAKSQHAAHGDQPGQPRKRQAGRTLRAAKAPGPGEVQDTKFANLGSAEGASQALFQGGPDHSW